MSWTVSAWAKGTHRTTGEVQAVRLQIIRAENDINEQYAMRGDVSGYYRTHYGAWADEVGSSAQNSEGPSPEPHPPGTLNADGDGYLIPDEAVAHLPYGDEDESPPTSPPA